MKNIVAWLEEVEEEAAALYTLAAEVFAGEALVAAFFTGLAEEESWHRQLVRTAGAALEGRDTETAIVAIDEPTRDSVDGQMRRAKGRLAEGKMPLEELLQIMIAVEFSEWNEIFLYAMSTLRGRGGHLLAAATEIDRHKEQISAFLASLPEGGRFMDTIARMPQVSGTRILIVERDPAAARVLQAVLATLGETEIVESIPEGLERVGLERYDVVLSDLDPDQSEGLEFYQQAVGIDPNLKYRFVFLTAQSQQDPPAIEEGAASGLRKPAVVSALRGAVAGVAQRRRILH